MWLQVSIFPGCIVAGAWLAGIQIVVPDDEGAGVTPM